MTEPRIIHLTADREGQRLDIFVASALPDLSRSTVQRLIKAGQVQVNDCPAKPAYRLLGGDRVTVIVPPAPPAHVSPEPVALDILYEDDDLVAINKAAGMVVHPAYGHLSGTLVNAALARWPGMAQVGGPERAGVVHRLDKGTSGVMLLAKTPAALESLQSQFKARTIYKRYLALVEGIPPSSSGMIEAPIGRDPCHRKRMAVLHAGRPSATRYTLREAFDAFTLLDLEPLTGRTHQLRVHLAWLGYPVVGDTVYGRRKQRLPIKRLFLHAAELHVDSPSGGRRLRFEAPLPAELRDLLAYLRRG